MAGDPTVTLRFNADGTPIVAATQQAGASLDALGNSAATASAKVADSSASMAVGLKTVSESADQAAARIHLMVQASLAQADANSSVAQSERAVAESNLASTAAFQEQLAARIALGAQLIAQDRLQALSNEAVAESSALGTAASEASTVAKRAEMEAVTADTAAKVVNVASSRAMYEASILLSEAASGNFSRMKRSLAALANATGVTASIFTATGASVAAALTVMAGAFAVVYKGEEETNSFNKALISTGNFAGTSAEALKNMAETIGSSTGQWSNASAAILKLAQSGKVSADSLQTVAQGAVDFAYVTGQSIDKATAAFEKLATDPAKEIVKLNDQYHFLTEATYDQIRAEEQAGDITKATSTAQQALAAAFHDRFNEVKAEIPPLIGYLQELKENWLGVWDAVKNIGNDSTQHQLDELLSKIYNIKEAMTQLEDTGNKGAGYYQSLTKNLDALNQQYDKLTRLAGVEKAVNAAVDESTKSMQSFTDQQIKDTDSADKLAASMQKLVENYKATNVQKVQNAINDKFIAGSAGLSAAAAQALAVSLTDEYGSAMKAAQVADALVAAHKGASQASKDQAQDEKTLAEVLQQAQQQVQSGIALYGQLESGLSGPWAAAQKAYNDQIATLAAAMEGLNTQLNLGEISQDQYAAKWQEISDAAADAGQKLEQTNAALKEQHDAIDQATQKLDELRSASESLGPVQRAQLQTDQEITKALKEHVDLLGNYIPDEKALTTAIQDQAPELLALNTRIAEQTQAMKDSEKAAREWENILTQGFGSMYDSLVQYIGGSIKSWSDFGKALVNDAKQMVAQIIAEFLKLRVLQPILAGLFGGGGSISGDLFSAAGTFLTTGSGTGSSNTGLPGYLSDIKGAYQTGSSFLGSLFGGGSGPTGALGDFSSPWTSGLGADTGSAFDFAAANGGSYPGFDAATAGVGNTGLGYGGYGSLLGQGLGIGAGLYSGYNEFNAAGGGIGGLAGGAAYGVGTYLAGGALASGVGALAGGAGIAGAGGAALGALGALGPLGWTALAAMGINMLSGGGLFGTSYQPTGDSWSDFSVGPGGGTVSAQASESKKGALFSGRSWRNVNLPIDQATQDAVTQFFQKLSDAAVEAGKEFGTNTSAVIAGTFHQQFSKGKLTDQYSEVLGKQYKETLQDFEQRMLDETILAALPASSGAEKIAEQWRSSAKLLTDGTNLLVQAELDIQHGTSLLGKGATLQGVASIVEELQKSGETLVQTYARLQQETNDVQKAFGLAGDAMNKTGADLVKFADGIATTSGGAKNAQSLWDNFFNNFYTKSELAQREVELLQPKLTADLAAVGLGPNTTEQQFRDAFEKALPKLTSDQVVQWLNLAKELVDFNQALGQVAGPSGSGSQFYQTMKSITDATNAATEAAQQNGEGETALAIIHRQAAQETAAAIAELTAQTQDLIAQLYGGMPGTLQGVQAAIQQTTAATHASTHSIGSAIQNTLASWQQGIQKVHDFIKSILLNTQLTTLTPQQQLAEAQSQFAAALAKAQGGDTTALGTLPQLAQQLLTSGRAFDSSGDAYQQLFNYVESSLKGLPDSNGAPAASQQQVQISPSPALTALYAKQDALLAQQTVAQRLALATQLAQHLNDLAKAINTPVLALAQKMGVHLDQLATDLGVNLKNLDANSVQALAQMATLLGSNLSDVTKAVGLKLTDLGGGVKELASSVGIDLTHLTGQTVASLATLAESLGTNVQTLATSVGIDLGSLANKQSLLNQALGTTISGLPQDEKSQLQPLFDAITNATTATNANAAVQALETAVNALPPQFSNQLAPYFTDIAPKTNDPNVTQLIDANGWLKQILAATNSVAAAINHLPKGTGQAAHALGSPYIDQTGVALIHQGEMVIDPQTSDMLRRYGIQTRAVSAPVTGNPDAAQNTPLLRAMVDEIKRLRDQFAALTAEYKQQTSAIVRQTDKLAYSRR